MSSPLNEIAGDVLADIYRNDYQRYVDAGRLVAKTVALEPGAAGLLINTQVIFHLLLCALLPFDYVFADRRPNGIRRVHSGGLRDSSGL